MTADGKIADKKRSPARFSSAADKAHLEKQISLVDGVLFGAGTLRAYGTTLPLSDPQLINSRIQQHKPPQPIHIVASTSGILDPKLRFFSQPIPRWLLTTTSDSIPYQIMNERLFDQILTVPQIQNPQSIDWIAAFTQLAQLGLNKLAILGGGELVASLLVADLIDEFWLTVCPIIFGGVNAPTPVEGVGFSTEQAQRLELLNVQRVEQEIFLHYRLQR